MRRFLSALVALSLALSLASVRAQDSPKPDEKKQEKKQDGKKPDEKKPDEKKDDPFPKPPEDLAKALARFEKDEEPQRELKRAFAQALYWHLARDAESFLRFFHPKYEHRERTGKIVAVPLADLRALLKETYANVPKTELKLEQLVDLSKVRVYSKKQAHDTTDEWKKKPQDTWSVMGDDDWLVIAPVIGATEEEKKDPFNLEVFFVFRKDQGFFKIVLGD